MPFTRATFATRPALIWGLVLLACPLSILAACAFGPLPLPVGTVLDALMRFPGTGQTSDSATLVVVHIRLSRVALAFITGSGLAVAGVVFQGVLRNPLADPFTLGVSGGAAFGASLAITLGLAARFVPLTALAGAGTALTLVLLLGRVGGLLRRETLVLAGVVVAAFLAALISLVKALDEDSVASIVFWIMGSFQNRGWQDMRLLLPGTLLGLIPIIILARELDILALGDTEARQLGLHAERSRFWLLLGASCITASCVAVSGIIGFVGLVVPHLARLLLGSRHVPLLAGSALGGGLLLLWSDVLARSILPNGVELPVGVITALLGGPFFCFLLRRASRAGVLS